MRARKMAFGLARTALQPAPTMGCVGRCLASITTTPNSSTPTSSSSSCLPLCRAYAVSSTRVVDEERVRSRRDGPYLTRKIVRCLYSALLRLAQNFDKNVHPSKQPWLVVDSLLGAGSAS